MLADERALADDPEALLRHLDLLLLLSGTTSTPLRGILVEHLQDIPIASALYDDGRAAVVANVGNLIAPVTRAGMLSGSDRIPDDLYAHNHQQEQWLKGFPSRPAALVGAGWGGHCLVTGGAVRGGQVVDRWPSYRINGEDDADDKGRIIPTLSVDQYGASLARWMGLSPGDVDEVFPDLQRGFDSDWRDAYGLFDVA